MHDFNARNRTAGRPKRFKPQHRTYNPLPRSMVLLHEVIKIFRVAQDHGGLVRLGVVRDRCGVAATLVDRDLLWEPLVPNRFV
jgi:hypothetical protein